MVLDLADTNVTIDELQGVLNAIQGKRPAAPDDVEEVPVVSTRDHYQIRRTFDVFAGRIREIEQLEPDPTTYDLPGEIPWGADEITVIVHGWGYSRWGAQTMFQTTYHNLREDGYDGAAVGFSYDVTFDTERPWQFSRWWEHFEIARKNGRKLARFVRDARERNPGVAINLVGHSMGVVPVMAALEVLRTAETSVDDAILLGAGFDADPCKRGRRYGSAIEESCRRCLNYHKTNDQLLQRGYSIIEDTSLGRTGCPEPKPPNHVDRDVTVDIADHLAYYGPEGVMSLVAEDMASDAGLDGG